MTLVSLVNSVSKVSVERPRVTPARSALWSPTVDQTAPAYQVARAVMTVSSVRLAMVAPVSTKPVRIRIPTVGLESSVTSPKVSAMTQATSTVGLAEMTQSVVMAIFVGLATAVWIVPITTARQALTATRLVTAQETRPATSASPIAGCSKTTHLALL